MTIGGKEIARHPPIAPEHFTEGKMGCDKCSAAAPSFPSAGDEYTCPFCKQRWRLTCEAPGAYWETIETYNSEKALSERLKSEFGKEME